MLNIEPIRLLSGSHDDTAQTGSGCFMNVIAYLNGEPQITDESPCVCRTIRRPAIWINDFLSDSERHMLLPFVQRAMGTATDDETVLRQRIGVMAQYIRDLAGLTQQFSPDGSAAQRVAAAELLVELAMIHSREYWTNPDYFADLVVSAATFAASACNSALERKEILDRSLAFMEAICPVADEPSRILIDRANRLLELATAQGE